MAHTDERRRMPRRRTRLTAAAVFGPPETVLLCTIKDKTDTGARLLAGPGAPLPDVFALVELSSGQMHSARVVWRDAAFVGVILQDSRLAGAAAGPEDQRLLEIRSRLIAKGSSGARAVG